MKGLRQRKRGLRMRASTLRASPALAVVRAKRIFYAAARSYPFCAGGQESDSVEDDSVADPTEYCDSSLITFSSLGWASPRQQ